MVSEQLPDGRWVRAVPLPFLGLFHVRCWECKRRFWFARGLRPAAYQQHYREQHL